MQCQVQESVRSLVNQLQDKWASHPIVQCKPLQSIEDCAAAN